MDDNFVLKASRDRVETEWLQMPAGALLLRPSTRTLGPAPALAPALAPAIFRVILASPPFCTVFPNAMPRVSLPRHKLDGRRLPILRESVYQTGLSGRGRRDTS